MKTLLVKRLFTQCCLSLGLVFLVSNIAYSAVVMNGTRVIMQDTTEKTIQFENTSQAPFLVQVSSAQSDQAKMDMVAIPPVFQIKAGGGQVVRLKLLNDHLPQDKESLFYFNFTQIPSMQKEMNEQSHLNIVVKSSVKLIYRPKSVAAVSVDSAENLTFNQHGNLLKLTNASNNVLSLSSISAAGVVLKNNVTLVPGESVDLNVQRATTLATLDAVLLNDYGVGSNVTLNKKS